MLSKRPHPPITTTPYPYVPPSNPCSNCNTPEPSAPCPSENLFSRELRVTEESLSLLLRFCRHTLTRHEPLSSKTCSTSRLELEKTFFRCQTELPRMSLRPKPLPHPLNCLTMNALHVSAFDRIAGDHPTICVAVLASALEKVLLAGKDRACFPE